MNIPTRADLGHLIEHRGGPCVSLFMPAHRAGAETRQDPIRFKNLIRDAQERLEAAGLRTPEARQFLGLASELLADRDFWQHQESGLAVFAGSGRFRSYRVPLNPPELVVVGSHFHVKPLLPLFAVDGPLYLLALSQNSVRLFFGTRFSLAELAPIKLPRSLEQALWFDQPERQLQFHTETAPRTGDRRAMFHGHGVGKDNQKSRVVEYFRELDRGMADLNREGRIPMVLACVEYLQPLFREATTYPWVLEEGIPGNPDEARPEELHREAWKIVEPVFMEKRGAVAREYRAFSGTGRTGKDLREVLPAADQGKVNTLFVAAAQSIWGRYDPSGGTLEVHGSPDPLDEDLLDLTAVYTLLRDGAVYVEAAQEMPESSPVAAIYRY